MDHNLERRPLLRPWRSIRVSSSNVFTKVLAVLLLPMVIGAQFSVGLDEMTNKTPQREVYQSRHRKLSVINPVESDAVVGNSQTVIDGCLTDTRGGDAAIHRCRNSVLIHTHAELEDDEEEVEILKEHETANEEAESQTGELGWLDETVEEKGKDSENQPELFALQVEPRSSTLDDHQAKAPTRELQDSTHSDHETPGLKTHDQGSDLNDQAQVVQGHEVVENIKETLPLPDNPYFLGPRITDWDNQRRVWLESNPHMRTTSSGKPRVLMVSGSDPWPCLSPLGDAVYVKSLKLKMDYARIHNYEFFYNFDYLDPLFNAWWVKYPLIRNLMLSHPEVEWFFWVDGDAVFSDVVFEAPLETYDGFNWIMQGYRENLFRDNSWVAVNAGVFLVRNCQWTLDLFDKWSPYGPDGPLRAQVGKVLSRIFSDRPENFPADDQSVLGYLIMTDETVRDKVKLIGNEYIMSGYWKAIQGAYEISESKYHPGLGDWRWPWVTHFVGCTFCMRGTDDPNIRECLEAFEKAYRFADNQVQMLSGLKYESPSSNFLIPLRNETDHPLEQLGESPWAERIAAVRASEAN